jgi:hypothetical protein
VDAHEIDIAVSDGDASWCSCTCGWASSKTSVKESSQQWTAHVAEHVFITARTPSF